MYVSIGSNIDKQKNIAACLQELALHFSDVVLSPIYESESVGFDGDNFYNLVVGIETDLSVGELSQYLKALEDQNGRRRDYSRFSARTLDIDILTYDDAVGTFGGVLLPRQEILENAFVLWPLAELAPYDLHPLEKLSYDVLWQDYDQNQSLWPVSFVWKGQELSIHFSESATTLVGINGHERY